jgi:uncharacterized membrane protein
MSTATHQSTTPPRPLETSPARVAAWAWVHRWPFVVWTAMVGWSLALFATVRSEYLEFRLARYDLGNMVQAVWSTAHGRPLEVTDAAGEQALRLASHVDPVLVLLAPFWLVAPSPLTLAAVQIVACALGALPVFWLARRHLESEKAAALLSLVYLVYPWLLWTALDAMHPVTLAIPLLLFAIWFLDSDRLRPFALCAILAASTGELVGVALAALGLWYCFSRGRRLAGSVVAALGVGWTVFCLEVIVPAFRDGHESQYYERFASVGGSPAGVLRTALTDPGDVIAALTTRADLSYLLLLALPLAGSFLFAPAMALVALPQLLVNMLSDFGPTTSPRTHYVAAVVPFLFAATVFGLARIAPGRRMRVVAVLLALSGMLSVAFAPWDSVLGGRGAGLHTKLPTTHVDALRRAVALVPADAPVSATNRAGSYLSARRYSYSVDIVGRAQWVVLDTWDARIVEAGWQPARFQAFRDRITRSAKWRKVFDQDGVLVFRRVGLS